MCRSEAFRPSATRGSLTPGQCPAYRPTRPPPPALLSAVEAPIGALAADRLPLSAGAICRAGGIRCDNGWMAWERFSGHPADQVDASLTVVHPRATAGGSIASAAGTRGGAMRRWTWGLAIATAGALVVGPVSGVSSAEDPPPDPCFAPPAGAILGTPGADVLVGTSGPDFIVGFGGNDTIYGFAGDDSLVGCAGDDAIYAGDGADDVVGDDLSFFGTQAPGGNDYLDAGRGDDSVTAGPGNDRIGGGQGDDFLPGATGNDTIGGGPGSDTIIGGQGVDSLSGGPGDDFMFGGTATDGLAGGPGDDLLVGDSPSQGDDPLPPTIDPGPNSDVCSGAVGIDTSTTCEVNNGIETNLDV